MKERKPVFRQTNQNLIVAITATLMLAASALAQDSETVLHTFTGGSDGGVGGTQLVADSAGNLYGTTFDGGNKSTSCGLYTGYSGCGVVFKLSPTANGSWKETVLYTFTGGADGGVPVAGVILDSAGNLYGTTLFGGNEKAANCSVAGIPPGCGVVFKLTPTAHGPWAETVLYTFTGGADGNEPWDRLTFDAKGNLYGTAAGGGDTSCNSPYGCGVVFMLSPGSEGVWTESVLHTFAGGDDGTYPFSDVAFDSNGNLYGTTLHGGDTSVICAGITGCGIVYQLMPTASVPWTETVLYRFTDGTDGAYPLFGLLLDSHDNIYGTTVYGGDTTGLSCSGELIPGCGVVFELAQGTWKETVLYTFTGGGDGGFPGTPVFDSAGNLYATANYGGAHNVGKVFKLTPTSEGPWTESLLYSFNGTGGVSPESNLIFDSAGNLYGMSQYGGNLSRCGGYGCGVVFKITTTSESSVQGDR